MGYCREIQVPEAEPVTLGEAVAHLRLPTGFGKDDVLTDLIAAARAHGETLTCGRALTQRKFVQVHDAFPAARGSLFEADYSLPDRRGIIKLAMNPVIAVESIVYLGRSGSAITLAQDVDFVLDRIHEPARLYPHAGQSWPESLCNASSVMITYTAGYVGTAGQTHTHAPSPPMSGVLPTTIVTTIQPNLRLAILNLVDFWFRNGRDTEPNKYLNGAFECCAIHDFAPTS